MRPEHKAYAEVTGQQALHLPKKILEVYPTPDALTKARDRVRALIVEGLPAGGVLVRLHGGEYLLREPLALDARDSGSEASPVIWRAAEGEKVVLSGAVLLNPAQFLPVSPEDPYYSRFPAPEKVRVLDLTPLGQTLPAMDNGFGEGYGDENNILTLNREMDAWPELYAGDRLLNGARWPKSGWLLSERCPNEHVEGSVIVTIGCGDEGLGRIADFTNVLYEGYPMYDWAFAAAPVASADRAAGTITLGRRIQFGARDGKRFFLFNVPEALREEGEYLLDPTRNRVFAVLPEGEPELRLSSLTGSLVRLTDASHVWFENLEFAFARGSGAIVYGGEDVRFCGCEFANLGFNAVRFGCQQEETIHFVDTVANGGRRHLVRSCDVHDVGFGGVYVSAGSRETLESCGITVENCDVRNFSRTGKCYCFGVFLTSVGAVIRNNRFHDGAHAAIWFDGNENVIEYNEFYDLLKEADDAAAVYCGRDYTMGGNVIRWNFFHDMTSDAKTDVSVFGSYCDDNSAVLAVYGNLYYRMQGAHHSHGGHDLTIENNLIVESWPNSKYSMTFGSYGFPASLKPGGRHAVLCARSPMNTPLWRMRYPHLREYVTWDPDSEGRYPHYCSYRNNALVRHLPIVPNFEWEKFSNVFENNPVLDVDVGFVDEEALDLRLREDSPIYALLPDFKPIPFEKIGIYRDVYRK